MHTILFLPHNIKISINEGENLIAAAMEAGVHINASCGGEGICGKCRIAIEQGEVEGGINEKLNQDDIDKGYRLACICYPKNDLIVRIPIESSIDKSVLNIQSSPRKTAKIKQMNLEDLKEKDLFLPPCEKKYIELQPPSIQDNSPDVSRIINHLRMEYDEHRLVMSLPIIRKTSDILRQNDFKVTVTLARAVFQGRKTRIINVQSGDTSNQNYAIAIDIGTTTIWGELIDLSNGAVLAQYADFNGQISYGEDVISRIVFAEKPGGLQKLHEVVLKTINSIIQKLIKRAGIDQENISTITLAGNTTMTQLFLEVNPRYIRRAPYVPASSVYPPLNAKSLGFDLPEHVTALFYPSISSYVGGDIVSGVMGSYMYRSDFLTLFLDIGTNAEIVIGNKEWLACAACSAGPAFEGGGIKFGMRASKGAIEDFSIDPVTYEPMLITIGKGRVRGICGSGLITIVAKMFEIGVIDNKGKFNRDLKTSRIREIEGVYEYVLSWAKETEIDRDVVITEPDIENLIRAKGAIYSGCMTLLEEVGLHISDIGHIILAGGFGSYIDLDKAMTIGLLPEIDAEKVTFIGNGSLLGARMSSLTNRIRRDVVDIVRKMTNFELSETKSYMDHYIAALFLPHTDINQFPKVCKRFAKKALLNGKTA